MPRATASCGRHAAAAATAGLRVCVRFDGQVLGVRHSAGVSVCVQHGSDACCCCCACLRTHVLCWFAGRATGQASVRGAFAACFMCSRACAQSGQGRMHAAAHPCSTYQQQQGRVQGLAAGTAADGTAATQQYAAALHGSAWRLLLRWCHERGRNPAEQQQRRRSQSILARCSAGVVQGWLVACMQLPGACSVVVMAGRARTCTCSPLPLLLRAPLCIAMPLRALWCVSLCIVRLRRTAPQSLTPRLLKCCFFADSTCSAEIPFSLQLCCRSMRRASAFKGARVFGGALARSSRGGGWGLPPLSHVGLLPAM